MSVRIKLTNRAERPKKKVTKHWMFVKGYPVTYRLRPMDRYWAEVRAGTIGEKALSFNLRVWQMAMINGKWQCDRILHTASFNNSDDAKAAGLMQVLMEGST